MRIRMILCLFLVGLVLIGGAVACGKSDDDSRATMRSESNDDEDGGGRSSRTSAEPEESTPPPTGLIKINEVTAEELAAYKISGLGGATAEGIIAYRDENGPFTSMADLDKAPRVGPAMLEKLQDRVDFGDAASAAAPATAPDAASAVESTEGAEPATAAPATAPAVSGNKININTATADQLVAAKIPRLGPALAQKIVDYRVANGPFKSLADLDQVSGVGPAMLEQLEDRVTF